MKQQTFESLYGDTWQQLATILGDDKKQQKLLTGDNADYDPRLPRLYRQVCHHLSLAQERHYSPYLVQRLNTLVLRGHQQLYRRQNRFVHNLIRYFVDTFPRRVREQSGYVWLATALFYGPGLILGLLIWLQPEVVYHVVDSYTVGRLESMYDPEAEWHGEERGSAGDMQMFGYYIRNNISIGFQTFASGLFAGLGSLFYLLYNGIYFGAIAGHIINIGYQDTFFPFVIGHGSFELTAIVLAGAAGLKLGHAVIAPGQRTRLDALKHSGRIALDIVYGVFVMLLIAAFFEAFWSSNAHMDIAIKYIVGAFLWALVIGYLVMAGRTPRHPGDR